MEIYTTDDYQIDVIASGVGLFTIGYLVSNYASLSAAVTAIGSTPATLFINTAQTVSTNLTIPSTLAIKMAKPGIITVNAGITLTINGPFEADLYQVFAGTGAVAFNRNSVQEVYPQWWGAVGDGTADDTAELQAALASYTNVKIPKGTYYITGALSPIANQTIRGEGAASIISLIDGTINGFYVNNVDDITIKDLSIKTKTQVTATASIAGIKIYDATRCLIDNVTFSSFGWAGIWLWDSTYCTVRDCKFYTWFGTIQDSSNIMVYNNSNYNLIDGNHCYGGGDYGIIVQDPYTHSTPTGNIITNNQVGEHKAYGIAVYVSDGYDTKTIVSNNHVHDILGTALAGLTGAGIYICGAGGCIVEGNQVSNCCRSTTNPVSLSMAHIAISAGAAYTGDLVDTICSNNHINASQGRGISVAKPPSGVIVTDNTIFSEGTAANYEEAIYVENSGRVKVQGNIIKIVNTHVDAITFLATVAAYKNIQINDNTITTAYRGISVTLASGGSWENVICKGNNVTGGNSRALYMEGVTTALISDNYFSSSNEVFYLNGVLNARLSNNYIKSTLTPGYSIIFSGTNTGSIVDETNVLSGVVNNTAGNGTIISVFGNTGPFLSGAAAVGDRVIQSIPVVGQPKGWRCTVAANPGTWVSEGNL